MIENYVIAGLNIVEGSKSRSVAESQNKDACLEFRSEAEILALLPTDVCNFGFCVLRLFALSGTLVNAIKSQI